MRRVAALEELPDGGLPLDAEEAREPGEVREAVGDALGKGDVNPDAALGERLEIAASVPLFPWLASTRSGSRRTMSSTRGFLVPPMDGSPATTSAGSSQ